MAGVKRKEVDCTRDILAFLARMGCFVWRNNTGVLKSGSRFVRFGKKGSGDILGILPNGRFFSVEVKSNGEPVSDSQKEFKELVEGVNGCAIIVKSLEEVIEFMESGIWE